MLAYAGQGRFVVQRVNLSDLVVELVSLLRTVVARTADIDVKLRTTCQASRRTPRSCVRSS